MYTFLQCCDLFERVVQNFQHTHRGLIELIFQFLTLPFFKAWPMELSSWTQTAVKTQLWLEVSLPIAGLDFTICLKSNLQCLFLLLYRLTGQSWLQSLVQASKSRLLWPCPSSLIMPGKCCRSCFHFLPISLWKWGNPQRQNSDGASWKQQPFLSGVNDSGLFMVSSKFRSGIPKITNFFPAFTYYSSHS